MKHTSIAEWYKHEVARFKKAGERSFMTIQATRNFARAAKVAAALEDTSRQSLFINLLVDAYGEDCVREPFAVDRGVPKPAVDPGVLEAYKRVMYDERGNLTTVSVPVTPTLTRNLRVIAALEDEPMWVVVSVLFLQRYSELAKSMGCLTSGE